MSSWSPLISRRAAGAPPIVGAACLLSALVVVLPGCNAGSGAVPVEGSITFQGNPVTSGVINFLPADGQPLGGGIDPDGTYSFRLPLGEYQVRIDSPPPVPEGYREGDPLPTLPPRQLPERYANYNTSGLTAAVRDERGRQTIDFHLP